jgi:hypothetical protein
MDYTLYTTVDITRTGQYRHEPGKETARWKEQNFQTVIQTLGIRANIMFDVNPVMITVRGKLVGFETNEIINIWQFDFSTEREQLYEYNNNPIGFLIEDFDAVPYIAGLDESMEQNFDVFVTTGPSKNIVFQQRQ